jgi:hypothetical protein
VTDEDVTPSTEYDRFRRLLERLLTVPRTLVEVRLKDYRERSLANPRRRGPKRRKASP